MNLKRLYLRHSLNFQKIKIKARNLEPEDFQKAYIIISRRLYRIVHLRNLVVFCLVFMIFVFSMFIPSFKKIETFYNQDKPLEGGTFAEGNLGKFSRLSPLYSETNPNDQDAVNLIFSGLLKMDSNSKLKPDLAGKWSISDDKKTYKFEMRKGIKWHDGAEFTPDDVLFTIGLIQNPDVRSSLYESWKGVKAEKTDNGVIFTLDEPSESFLENTTVKILPKHILASIPPRSMQTVDFNTNPVGTGPYKFESLKKESGRETVILAQNEKYYDKKPYITKILLEAFSDEKDLVDEYNKRNIKGVGNPDKDLRKKLSKERGTNLHEYALPRYIGMFFNVESEKLKDKNLRVGLSQVIDRKNILASAVDSRALPAYFAIPPSLANTKNLKPDTAGSSDKAAETLKANGYILENGQLKKDGQEVSLKIATGDMGELKKTAESISKSFKKLGIKTEIKSENMNVLQKDYIRPRNYDILIIGEDLGFTPDLFSFWHSSQIADPGLNFSKYKNRKLDKFLEIVRKTQNADEKNQKLEEIQKIIMDDVPAVYLYNPYYVFATSDKIKGITEGKMVSPSDRFLDVANWYVKSKRVPIDD